MSLSFRQKNYIEILLAMSVPNEAEAARQAGYKHCHVQAHRFRKHPEIVAEIQRRRDILLKKIRADQLTGMQAAVDCVNFDISMITNPDGSVKPPSEWPRGARVACNSYIVDEVTTTKTDSTGESRTDRTVRKIRVTFSDRTRAIEHFNKLCGNFVENIEIAHTGVIRLPGKLPPGAPIEDSTE